MAPPEAPVSETGHAPPAVPFCVERLRRRTDFLALNRAQRKVTNSMLVQGRDRRDESNTLRVGFTCSKKLGNAVSRNRAKRRLREVARQLLPVHGRPGWDYALIGRPEATIASSFDVLKQDLLVALRGLHKEP